MNTSLARLFLFLAVFLGASSSSFALKVGDTFLIKSQRTTQGATGYVYTWLKAPSGATYYDNTYRPGFATSDGYHDTYVTLNEGGTWTLYTSTANTADPYKPDGVDFSSAIPVDKLQPTITWAALAEISDKTAISSAQLSATASYQGTSVPGSYAYSYSKGSLSIGDFIEAYKDPYPLSVVFTPSNTAMYENASGSNTLQVIVGRDNQTITIVASPASPVPKGTAVTFTVLNGKGTGDYNWTGAYKGTTAYNNASASLTFDTAGRFTQYVLHKGDDDYFDSLEASIEIVVTDTTPAPVITSSSASTPTAPTATISADDAASTTPVISWTAGNAGTFSVTKNGAAWASSGTSKSDSGLAAATTYTYTITAQPATYSSTLNWSATNATSYTVTGPGTATVSGTSATVSAPGEYTLTATGSGGSTTTKITAPAAPSAATASCTVTPPDPAGPTISSPTATLTGSAASATTATISASPSSGKAPLTPTISWTVGNASSFSVTKVGDASWSASSDTSKPDTLGTIGTYTYSITAQPPAYSATLSWSSTNATSYAVTGPNSYSSGSITATTVTVSAAGTYSLTATGATGKTFSTTVTAPALTAATASCTVTVSAKLSQAAVTSANGSIERGASFTPTASGGSGTGAYQFYVDGVSSSWGAIGAWTPSAAQTYTFRVRRLGDDTYDLSAESGNYTLTVTAPTTPPPTIGGPGPGDTPTAAVTSAAKPSVNIGANPTSGFAPLKAQVGCSVSNASSWVITKNGEDWLSNTPGDTSGGAKDENALAQGSYAYVLTAQPAYSAKLTWTATNTTSTTVTGPGTATVSGTTATVTAPGLYTITATGPGGSKTATVTAPAGGTAASASVTVTVAPGRLQQEPVYSADTTIKNSTPFLPIMSGGSGTGAYEFFVDGPMDGFSGRGVWRSGAFSPAPDTTYTFRVRRQGDSNYDLSAESPTYTLTQVSYLLPNIQNVKTAYDITPMYGISADPQTGTAPLTTELRVVAWNCSSFSITKNGVAWASKTSPPMVTFLPDTLGAGETTYRLTVQPSSNAGKLSWDYDANTNYYIIRGPNGFVGFPSDNLAPSIQFTDPGSYTIEAYYMKQIAPGEYAFTPHFVNVVIAPNPAKTDSVTVTTTGLPQTVTLTPVNSTITAGNSATLTAAGGRNGYTWGASASGTGATATKTVTFPNPGTYTVTAQSPAGGNYAASNTATATIRVTTSTSIQSLVPVASDYIVINASSPANGRTYKRLWQEGGAWQAYLGRSGLRFTATGSGSSAVKAFELQVQEPGSTDWTTLATATPANGASNGPGVSVAGDFSGLMIDSPTPGSPLVPLSYSQKAPKVGVWNFRARVQNSDDAWSGFTAILPITVELPIAVVAETLRTLPPAGPEGAWFTASKPKTFHLPVWIP